jgi:hypothetical protein
MSVKYPNATKPVWKVWIIFQKLFQYDPYAPCQPRAMMSHVIWKDVRIPHLFCAYDSTSSYLHCIMCFSCLDFLFTTQCTDAFCRWKPCSKCERPLIRKPEKQSPKYWKSMTIEALPPQLTWNSKPSSNTSQSHPTWVNQVAIDETPNFGAGLRSASHPHGRDEMGGMESNGSSQI